MHFVATLRDHPRKLWLRRALFQVHLWAGVLLSLYVVVIALTGSVLVFRNELTRVQLPKALNRYEDRTVAPFEDVVRHFVAAYPDCRIETLQTPSPQLPAFLLFATDAHHRPFRLAADPVDGRLWPQPPTTLDWIYDLHVYLLLGHAYGMQVNGIGAAILMLLALSGLFLWWPGLRIWTRGLRIDFARNWRRINFDAHNAIGFWTLSLVFSWALSGIYFGWYRQVTTVVATISPLQGMISPRGAPPPSGPGRVPLQEILIAVQQASPHGRIFSISDPAFLGPVTYVLSDLRAPGDFSHRDIIALSTVNARVLSVWHYGENHSAGDWILWAMHPLHFGTVWGLAFKILWALCGLALAMLTVTGLLMYWNRFLRRQFASRPGGR